MSPAVGTHVRTLTVSFVKLLKKRYILPNVVSAGPTNT
jgi:hypothetical protein